MSGLVSWILGEPLPKSEGLTCRRCRKPVGIIMHHPIRLCPPCHRLTVRDLSAWQSYCETHREEVVAYRTRAQSRPTRLDLKGDHWQASVELTGMRNRVLELEQLGRVVEAAEARKAFERRQREVQEIGTATPEMLAQLESEK